MGSRRRLDVLLLLVAIVLLAGCRDEDLDHLRVTPTAAPTPVTFSPAASYFVQQMEDVGDFRTVSALLPFEPVLPSYLPGEMQVVSVIAQPALPGLTLAFAGPGGSLTLSEWQAGGVSSAGESIQVGRADGRLAISTTGARLLTWEACDLTFTLTSNPFPPGDPITQDELVRVAESILAACE